MPNKTFHIPDRELPLWDAAQRVADHQGVSLYRVLAEALATDLPRIATKPRPAEEWAAIAADAA